MFNPKYAAAGAGAVADAQQQKYNVNPDISNVNYANMANMANQTYDPEAFKYQAAVDLARQYFSGNENEATEKIFRRKVDDIYKNELGGTLNPDTDIRGNNLLSQAVRGLNEGWDDLLTLGGATIDKPWDFIAGNIAGMAGGEEAKQKVQNLMNSRDVGTALDIGVDLALMANPMTMPIGIAKNIIQQSDNIDEAIKGYDNVTMEDLTGTQRAARGGEAALSTALSMVPGVGKAGKVLKAAKADKFDDLVNAAKSNKRAIEQGDFDGIVDDKLNQMSAALEENKGIIDEIANNQKFKIIENAANKARDTAKNIDDEIKATDVRSLRDALSSIERERRAVQEANRSLTTPLPKTPDMINVERTINHWKSLNDEAAAAAKNASPEAALAGKPPIPPARIARAEQRLAELERANVTRASDDEIWSNVENLGRLFDEETAARKALADAEGRLPEGGLSRLEAEMNAANERVKSLEAGKEKLFPKYGEARRESERLEEAIEKRKAGHIKDAEEAEKAAERAAKGNYLNRVGYVAANQSRAMNDAIKGIPKTYRNMRDIEKEIVENANNRLPEEMTHIPRTRRGWRNLIKENPEELGFSEEEIGKLGRSKINALANEHAMATRNLVGRTPLTGAIKRGLQAVDEEANLANNRALFDEEMREYLDKLAKNEKIKGTPVEKLKNLRDMALSSIGGVSALGVQGGLAGMASGDYDNFQQGVLATFNDIEQHPWKFLPGLWPVGAKRMSTRINPGIRGHMGSSIPFNTARAGALGDYISSQNEPDTSKATNEQEILARLAALKAGE